MADGTVGVKQATSPDRLIDNETLVIGSQTVYRQRVQDPEVIALLESVKTAVEGTLQASIAGDVNLSATTLAALETVNAVVTGAVTATVTGTVALDAATLAALETVTAAVTGTVALDAPTLAALESITAAVTGTVALDATTLAALEAVTVSGAVDVTNFPIDYPDADTLAKLEQILQELGQKLEEGGTVALDVATLAALESISATVTGTVDLGATTLAALESISVSGTVELGAATLAALETVTANQGAPGASAWPVDIQGGTVEISNLQQLSVLTVLNESNFDIDAAPYSDTAAFAQDSLLGALALRFSTTAARNVSVTHSDGTVLWDATADSSLAVDIDFEDFAMDAGTSVTVSVSSTASACILDVTLTAKVGTSALGGNPVLGEGDAHIGEVSLGLAANAAGDAGGRLRVSNPENIHDFKMVSLHGTLTYGHYGDGSNTLDLTRAGSVLSIGTTSGHKQTRIKHAPVPYQPGRSQMLMITGVLGAAKANVARRMGMVDGVARNNGIYLEQRGTSGVYLVIRSSASGVATSTTDVEQANWNLDSMDGTGPSGVTLDLSMNQLFIADFRWLSAGRVRFGFEIDGQIIYVHESMHANVISLPFMRTPNLRPFWQIENLAASASSSDMLAVCVAVASEGGRRVNGRSQGASTGSTVVSISTAAPQLVLAVRPELTLNGIPNACLATLKELQLVSDKDIYYRIVYFPTFSGGTWTSMTDNSMMEYNAGHTTPTTVSGGQQFEEGFVVAAQGGRAASFSQSPDVGEREVMSLTGDDSTGIGSAILAQNLGTGTASVRATLRWTEERQ